MNKIVKNITISIFSILLFCLCVTYFLVSVCSKTDDEISNINIYEDVELELPEPIELNFEPVILVYPQTIESNNINIIKNVIAYKYNIYIYSKKELNKDEPVDLFAGIKINEKIYELGEIGYSHYLDMIDINEIEIKEIEYIKINGALGAAYPINYYLTVEHDVPVIYINKELPISLLDLDNDGTLEWISEYDGQISIYKMLNNEWSFVSLNDTIDGYIYQENQENKFNIVRDRGSEKQKINTYLFKKNRLVPTTS